jgi:hypothetical protein
MVHVIRRNYEYKAVSQSRHFEIEVTWQTPSWLRSDVDIGTCDGRQKCIHPSNTGPDGLRPVIPVQTPTRNRLADVG